MGNEMTTKQDSSLKNHFADDAEPTERAGNVIKRQENLTKYLSSKPLTVR